MESIVSSLETEAVPRLRLGVARADGGAVPTDLSEFVLAPFDVAEREVAAALIERGAEAAHCWLTEGIEAAMARFNVAPPAAAPLAPEPPLR
jgi:peptidyl-tRNA hydrolase